MQKTDPKPKRHPFIIRPETVSMDGEISPAELETLLEDGDAPTIVDIRNPPEFQRERIPGSRNIPFNAIPQEVEQLSDEDHVVTVCPHGKASIQAAKLITSFEGFDGRVESLESGIVGWDGPMEDDRETQTDTSPDAPF